MFTESHSVANLISATVENNTARTLLYQARVNLQLFDYARTKVHVELEALNNAAFALAHTSHMLEGVFGAAKHTAAMMEHKEGVLCFLSAAITSGHRVIRSISSARDKDRGRDWKRFRVTINLLEDNLRKTRNFLEHMDEAIAKGEIANGMDCTFSRDAVLTMKENGITTTFDFSAPALEKISKVYKEVIQMLEERNAAPSGPDISSTRAT